MCVVNLLLNLGLNSNSLTHFAAYMRGLHFFVIRMIALQQLFTYKAADGPLFQELSKKQAEDSLNSQNARSITIHSLSK